MKKLESTVEAINYILKKLGKTDKLTIIKLLYLADKCHLVRLGRTITEDEYYAMNYGPVGSLAKDILTNYDDNITFSASESEYIKSLINPVDKYYFEYKNGITEQFLSESDYNALDIVLTKYSNLSSDELVKITHNYPEWKQHESKLCDSKSETKRVRIKNEELLSLLSEDYGIFNVDAAHVEMSKNILLGYYD